MKPPKTARGRAGDCRPQEYIAGTRFLALMREDGRGGGTSEEVLPLGEVGYEIYSRMFGNRGGILKGLVEVAVNGLDEMSIERMTERLGELHKEIEAAQGLIVLLVQSCRPGNARHPLSKQDYSRLTSLARSNKLAEMFAATGWWAGRPRPMAGSISMTCA